MYLLTVSLKWKPDLYSILYHIICESFKRLCIPKLLLYLFLIQRFCSFILLHLYALTCEVMQFSGKNQTFGV